MTSVRQSGEQRAGGVSEAARFPLVAHYRQSFTAETQKDSKGSQLTDTQTGAANYINTLTFSQPASIPMIWNAKKTPTHNPSSYVG